MSNEPRFGTLVSPQAEDDPLRTIETSPTVSHNSDPSVSISGDELGKEEILGGRFAIKELIQSGGMGDVYRATDLVKKVPVAVKTLRFGTASPIRFEREATRLAELNHENIPRYVTHDLVGADKPYLVMEWLDGSDLSSVLRARRLKVQESFVLFEQVLRAVDFAHQKKIVHRDLNPSNIFLVDSSVEKVKVLDFGVSRLESGEQPYTAEGTQIGTPGYMAPEQVEGRNDVTPAADVFALGCLLYELISTQRAFLAPTIRELLTRIVKDDPTDIRELVPGIPDEYAQLVELLLRKNPAERPGHAGEVLALVRELPAYEERPVADSRVSAPGSGVQQVTSLIVLRSDDQSVFGRAVQAAQPHGLKVRRGIDDTIVIATAGRGTAGDHAARAARCALAIQRATRVPQLAVSTGLSQQVGEALSGRAFDSALVSLLLKDSAPEGEGGSSIWLDENTASLLDSRFEVRSVEQGFLLRGIRNTYEPARTVLGRQVRCVGRKRELSMLAASLDESFEDSVASSVLITGPPGSGKSRLASETVRAARRGTRGIQVFRGGGDPMTAGAPYWSLIEALQRACRMREGEPDSVRRGKLHDRLKPLLKEEEFSRVAEFLGELLGVFGDVEPSKQLEAARRDAVLRGDQILRALEDWLKAECRAHPVLLILDDFHWGDLATCKFVDNALRNLAECPLVVVTLARPEVHELFPKLWVKRGVTELRLSGLSRRAATEMVKEVLGEDAVEKVIDRVINRAQGNPFWIEELLRAEDAGQGENVPDRVVLLAQSRIEQLRPEERRLLEVASVYGQQFWLGGARALLGAEAGVTAVETAAADLVEAEFIIEHELSRLGGEKEFQFASGLLRDAAYALLEEQEREEAHAQAAAWLEKNSEADPLAIALHFTLGGDGERARSHYLTAAQMAVSGDDLASAISCAEEGLSAGARGLDAVRLHLVHAEASKWRGENAVAFRSAQAAFARAEESTSEWYRAAAEAAVSAGKTGKAESCLAIAKELTESHPPRGYDPERSVALARVASQLVFMNKQSVAAGLLEAIGDADHRLEPDARVLGYVAEARALVAGASEDPVGRIEHAEQAIVHFENSGDLRNACLARLSQGFAEIEFGLVDSAAETLEGALRVARRMGLENSIPVGQLQLGRARARQGKMEEGLRLVEEAASTFDRHKNLRLAGMARLYLCDMHLGQGHQEAALEAAERAEGILRSAPPLLRIAHASKAIIFSEWGDPEEARICGEIALQDLSGDVRLPVAESFVRLGGAIGLISGGDSARGRQALAAERERVARLARSMPRDRAIQFIEGSAARDYIMNVSSKDASGSSNLSYPAFLMERENQSGDEMSVVGQEAVTLKAVTRICEEKEPVLRNLWITQSYFELSREIAKVVDGQNLNWSTFACWASKTAGISIRNEEVPELFKRELGLGEEGLSHISSVRHRLLSLFGLVRFVRRAALQTLQDVSSEIAIGNRKVYAELAPLFARFVDLMRANPSEASVEAFTASFQSGPIEQGGQELLMSAFTNWYQASQSESPRQRAQLILEANCKIGLHEQTRLQPHIQQAMDAPVDVLIRKNIRLAIRGWFGGAISRFAQFMAAPFVAELTKLWQEVATRFAMNLCLPGGKEISLGADLPAAMAAYPQDLDRIDDPKTLALIRRYDPEADTMVGAGANNWAELDDRMGFIVELFRSQQQKHEMFDGPFTDLQEEALNEGRIPDGDL